VNRKPGEEVIDSLTIELPNLFHRKVIRLTDRLERLRQLFGRTPVHTDVSDAFLSGERALKLIKKLDVCNSEIPAGILRSHKSRVVILPEAELTKPLGTIGTGEQFLHDGFDDSPKLNVRRPVTDVFPDRV